MAETFPRLTKIIDSSSSEPKTRQIKEKHPAAHYSKMLKIKEIIIEENREKN